jgi:hypothetical protein
LITSRDNERLKLVRKLHDSSRRTARRAARQSPDDDGYALVVERHPAPSERLGAFDFRGAWLDRAR